MIRWLAITLIAALYGFAAAQIFGRLTNLEAVRRSIDAILARALELPLFFDEPAVIWRAQWAIARENLHILRLVALPAAITAAAFLILCQPLDKYLARRPLEVGEAAVLSGPRLTDRPGLVIETPPVHIPKAGTVSWRVRASTNGADPVPYHGPRSSWLPWFAAISAVTSAAGISRRR